MGKYTRDFEKTRKTVENKTRRRKYNNTVNVYKNIRFDSKAERDYYKKLELLEKAGEVKKIELQPRFLLQEGFTKNGKRHRPIHYIADFRVEYSDGREEIVDVKGRRTQVFNMKYKMFEYKYPDKELKIVEV